MKKNLDNMISSAFSPGEKSSQYQNGCANNDEEDQSDSDEDEREQFRRREVKKMFDLVDKDGSGYIDRKELETLMKSLNKTFSSQEINEGFARIDVDLSGRIEFSEFYEWYKQIYSEERRTEDD
jgi:Ca2+-binding EF-hand superfamily protein